MFSTGCFFTDFNFSSIEDGSPIVSTTDLSMGHFTILYFASAGSFTSKSSECLPAPLPLSQLFDFLEARYEGIKTKILDNSMVAINLEYVNPQTEVDNGCEITINNGDEVAIIPPVSSG